MGMVNVVTNMDQVTNSKQILLFMV